MEGWISLHRKIRCNPLFKENRNFSKFEAWIDMLMDCNHADNKWLCNNEMILVERGSFVTSELKLMERWRWSKSKVRAFLKLLQNEEMIVKKTDSKKTTIFIVNYDYYQTGQTTKEPQKDCKKTAEKPQKDTNNNDNNVNNDNKRNSGKNIPPMLAEVEAYCNERNNGIDAEQFIAFYQSKDWMIGKNKMKDWKSAIITWEKKKNLDNKEKQPEYRDLTNAYKG